MKIFDSQVNWGKNLFGPDSDIGTYLENAGIIGVYKALIIPTGTHEINLDDGSTEKSCIWLYENGKILYKKIIITISGKEIEEFNPQNPYSKMNKKTLNLIKQLNSSQKKIKFYFAPKIHPQLDVKEEVEQLIENDEVRALKIQTISSYTTVNDIPGWLSGLSQSYDLPLMIHTDYVDSSSKSLKPEMRKIMMESQPIKWINWAKNKNVRMFLAHGLRLDPESAAIVNDCDNFIVGSGPDLLLQAEQSRLVTKTQDYLAKLFELVNEDKITFNTDYRWNVKERNNWNSLDWNSPKRIFRFAKKHSLNEDFLEKILFRNGEQFFKIED